MSIPVKHFNFEQTGAPQCTGEPGSMIAVLDACLVNGFNLNPIDSLSVTGGVATVSVSAGHGFTDDMVVLIEGATPTALNGEKRVTNASTTTFDFDATGVADGAATGAISCKTAPAGWEKAFSGTNVAVYRMPAFGSNSHYLRVDDTDPQWARLRGYESMTDVDTGVGPFPTTTQSAGGLYWYKTATSSASYKSKWVIVADDMFMYWLGQEQANGAEHYCYAFGYPVSYRAGDTYHAFVSGERTDPSSAPGISCLAAPNATACRYLSRASTQIGGAEEVRMYGGGVFSSWYIGSASTPFVYPNIADNSLLLASPYMIVEFSTNVIRGEIPGFYMPLHNKALQNRDVVSDIVQLPGRSLLFHYGARSIGSVMIDITGPWR